MPEADVKPIKSSSWVDRAIPPFLSSPERRHETAVGSAKALGTAAGVGAIAKIVPHQAGVQLAKLGAGLEKSPTTGKLKAGPLFLTNLLPVPFGFVDPTIFGLERNYYLPAGSSLLIPRFVDRFGLGTREQRAADEAAAELARRERFTRAQERLQRFDSDRVREIAAGRPTQEEHRLFSEVYSVDRETLVAAAQRVTGQSTDLVDALSQLVADTVKTFAPSLVEPTNAAAKRSADKAEGIRKELITEYADP